MAARTAAHATKAVRQEDHDKAISQAAACIQSRYRGNLERRRVEELDDQMLLQLSTQNKTPEVAQPSRPPFASPEQFAGRYEPSGRLCTSAGMGALVRWELTDCGKDYCGCGRRSSCFVQRVCGCPCAAAYLCECDDGIYCSATSLLPCVMVYEDEALGVCFVPLLVHDGKRVGEQEPPVGVTMQRA